ncbi:hypothetical protein FA95DRAFT_286500 [Auriscalpium vulgare]|uniref:Uncharacterized protein n=1 Tax=Auriscalpium vulgare TaxID=40419 RepID=A0ACB8RK46_9AGAM|nr:hypothetical protein FA95DRAFT_286500 [Auriscalpium vulgare]
MELCTPCAKYIRRNQLAAHIGGRPHQRKLAALPRTLHVVEDVSGLPPAIPNGANDSGYAEHMESPPGCDWTGSSQDQVVDEGHGGVFVSGEQGVNLGDLERTTAVLPAAAPLFEEEEMLLSHEGTGITVSEEAGLRFGIIERAESGIYPSSTAKFIVTKENIQPLVTFVEARFSSEEGFSAALEGQSKYIKSNEPRTIVVTFLPPYEGSFEATIDLVFYDWARKGTFVVPRSVSGTAGTPHDHVLLAPRAMHVMPPARPRYKAPLHVNPYRPPTWTRGQSKGFGQYPLPPDWNGLLEDRGLDNRQYEEATARLLRAKLPGILKPETYAHHYRVLMNAEDAAQQRLLADNPPVEVTLTQRGDSFMCESLVPSYVAN